MKPIIEPDYQEAWALKETATNEMRTPEMQILWILRQLLDLLHQY